MTPRSTTQPALPAPLSVPDNLRVVGPMQLPAPDRRAAADKIMHKRRDEVVAKVNQTRGTR